MIPDRWYPILDSKEVKQGKAVGVTRMRVKLRQGDRPIMAYRRKRGELMAGRQTSVGA